jgi:hypothetical protein
VIVNGGFDDLVPEGFTVADPGFETGAGWVPAATGPEFMPFIQIFSPGSPVQMLDAVSRLYEAAAGSLTLKGGSR